MHYGLSPIEDDKRGAVLEAVSAALKHTLADRPAGVDLDGQARPAINPPSLKIEASDENFVRVRVFTGRHEYRVTIEAVRP